MATITHAHCICSHDKDDHSENFCWVEGCDRPHQFINDFTSLNKDSH